MNGAISRLARVALVVAAVLWAGCDRQHVVGALDGSGGNSGGVAGGTAGSGGTAGGVGGVGGTAGGAAGSGGMTTGAAGNGPGGAPVATTQSWTGYIENHTFPSGSDAIHITFTGDASGQLTGTVTFGSGTPPPPATDPSVGYPPDVISQSNGQATGISLAADRYIAEGFAYTMHDGTLAAGRLRFGFITYELWTGWCALQQPVPGYTTCLPDWGAQGGGTVDNPICWQVNPTTKQNVPVDCGRLSLCYEDPACTCSASACAVRNDGIETKFDVAISGDSASGSVLGVFPMSNVQFTADP